VPFAFARDDIFFLHHILELCYYFLPEEGAAPEVFDLLVYCIAEGKHEKIRSRRSLVLAKLFLLFGMYPEHDILCAYMEKVMDVPLDRFFDVPCDGTMESLLRRWVWSCIITHSHREQFKTVRLLKGVESA
jgi:hypothetical protein